jgi:nicotinate-nucleotide adenylyltransferase
MDRDQGAEPSQASPRVAFFGGSFDPPHLGHLAIARAAREALGLGTVLFAPVGAQPLKPKGSTAPFADRIAMTELAIAGEPGFEISLADAPDSNGKPNYTLETLRRLRGDLGPHAALFCLMGADSFVSLRKWRGGSEIPFAATLIVASRPGLQLDDLSGLLGNGLSLAVKLTNSPSQMWICGPLWCTIAKAAPRRFTCCPASMWKSAPLPFAPRLRLDLTCKKRPWCHPR